MDRGYKGGEIDTQLKRVKGLQRDTLLNRESKPKDGTRIPLVLTFHPALNEVHEILRKCENILLVDREHRRIFSGKLFVSFRRPKNFKDTLVRAKLQPENEELVEKGTHKCNGRRCQICPMMQEGSMFYIMRMILGFLETFRGRMTATRRQGRRHGVDWGGHVHPTLLRSVFIPKQKRHSNR